MDTLTSIGIIAAIVGTIAGVVQILDYLQKRREQPGDPAEDSASKQKPLIHLRRLLTQRFNESELQTVCFDLGVDYENLPGQSKVDKARELVEYLERRDRIPELIETGKRLRAEDG